MLGCRTTPQGSRSYAFEEVSCVSIHRNMALFIGVHVLPLVPGHALVTVAMPWINRVFTKGEARWISPARSPRASTPRLHCPGRAARLPTGVVLQLACAHPDVLDDPRPRRWPHPPHSAWPRRARAESAPCPCQCRRHCHARCVSAGTGRRGRRRGLHRAARARPASPSAGGTSPPISGPCGHCCGGTRQTGRGRCSACCIPLASPRSARSRSPCSSLGRPEGYGRRA